MKISMKFNGRWFVPIVHCDGCGQEIKKLDDGIACYNSKLRSGEEGRIYFSHVLGNCGCIVDEKAKAENQGKPFFLHPIKIDRVLLDAIKELCPELR